MIRFDTFLFDYDPKIVMRLSSNQLAIFKFHCSDLAFFHSKDSCKASRTEIRNKLIMYS